MPLKFKVSYLLLPLSYQGSLSLTVPYRADPTERKPWKQLRSWCKCTTTRPSTWVKFQKWICVFHLYIYSIFGSNNSKYRLIIFVTMLVLVTMPSIMLVTVPLPCTLVLLCHSRATMPSGRSCCHDCLATVPWDELFKCNCFVKMPLG